jgi:translocation and assembly module TamB
MKLRWHHWAGTFLALAILVGGVLAFLGTTGLARLWMRRYVTGQLESVTGGRVELGRFQFHWWGLHGELDNFTLHGSEGPGIPPLFHADRIRFQVHIVSVFGGKLSLRELVIDRPEIGVRFDGKGRSNVPGPKPISASREPWSDQLFDLEVGKLELNDGTIHYNDVTVPLALEGSLFNFKMSYHAPAASPEAYEGEISWMNVNFVSGRSLPLHSQMTAKFSLTRGAFSLDDFHWKLPHSELDARAEAPNLALNDWKFAYRGHLALQDIRETFRSPTVPDSRVDFSGAASVTAGAWAATGHFAGHEVDLPYEWFHAGGMEAWGDYVLANGQLSVAQLNAQTLGGTMQARLNMDVNTLAFQVESKLRGLSLARIFAALDNPSFPVNTFHWDAAVDVDAVNSWAGAFEHFRTRGEMRWGAPPNLAPKKIPAEARVDFDYSQDKIELDLAKSEISTPSTRMTVEGPLGGHDSGVEYWVHTDDLTAWQDFINTVRGKDTVPENISGQATWKGRILGPIVGPTFAGRIHGADVHYGSLKWDDLEGAMSYSPEELQLNGMQVRYGKSSAVLDLRLQLDGDWGFLPKDALSFNASFSHDPTEDWQTIFETNYPVSGFLTGHLTGSGTRADPAIDGDLILDQIEARGMHFDQLTTQLHWRNNQVHLTDAVLAKGAGRITGNVAYGTEDHNVGFTIHGESILLANISLIQTSGFPVTGTLGFDLQGSGPLRSPQGRGKLQFQNLKIGSEIQGNFGVSVASTGEILHVALTSEMNVGTLRGDFDVKLGGDYAVSGQLVADQFDIDPVIMSRLHLKDVTGHSSFDGHVNITGGLRDLRSLKIDADLTSLKMDYDFVKLQNEGDIRLNFSRYQITVQQAHLSGTDTDFQLSGSARFDGTRPVNLSLTGKANLRFAKGFLPLLQARGAADVRVSVEGTMSDPSIIGRVSVKDASAVYDDFPTGLSHVTGDIVFDRDRALFENVSAESGGGHLTLAGSMGYGGGPLRYDLDVIAPQIRIRYPVGMSWLAGGTAHLQGTADAALLSGNVQVSRLLLGSGVDLATLITTSQGSVQGPATTSSFLRNLQFDIGANTAPNARMEWSGAHVEMEGSMRLRGNWDRPILLGSIHLLNGDMTFRGNTYTLSRGDVIFSNPFRLDPVLNVEATTVIDQYEVTLDFSGPASNMSLSYRSDPPLPDTDIIALLALGSTGTQGALRSSSAQGTQSYGATALLSEAISSELGGRIEKLFGISNFRVDPFLAGTASEQNAAARVTIEKQVGRALTITYSTNAASDQEQVIQVVYTLRRDLSVIALRDYNGTFSLSVEFTKHFK